MSTKIRGRCLQISIVDKNKRKMFTEFNVKHLSKILDDWLNKNIEYEVKIISEEIYDVMNDEIKDKIPTLKMPCGCKFENGKAYLCSDKHLKLWEKVLIDDDDHHYYIGDS